LTVKPYLFEWLVATTLLIAGCRSPWDVIRPVIHEGDGRIAAIKSAPTILLVEIQHTKLFTKPLEVEKPPTIGGPMVPRIPLYLAEISAKVLRTMRGAKLATSSSIAGFGHQASMVVPDFSIRYRVQSMSYF